LLLASSSEKLWRLFEKEMLRMSVYHSDVFTIVLSSKKGLKQFSEN
jgi:hypothetical protein